MSFWDDTIEAVDRSVGGALGGLYCYRAGSGASKDLPDGIFSDEHVEVKPDIEVGISTQSPTLFVPRLADLPSNPKTDIGARVTVGGRGFKIIDVHKDGQGAGVLILHEIPRA